MGDRHKEQTNHRKPKASDHLRTWLSVLRYDRAEKGPFLSDCYTLAQGIPDLSHPEGLLVVVDRLSFRWPFDKQFRSIIQPKTVTALYALFSIWPKESISVNRDCFSQIIGQEFQISAKRDLVIIIARNRNLSKRLVSVSAFRSKYRAVYCRSLKS